jgi:CHAT domain-containing protein
VPVPLDPTTGRRWIQAAPAIAVEQWPDFPAGEPGSAPEMPAPQMRVHLDLPALARLVYYVLPEKTVVLGVSAAGDIQGAVVDVGEPALIERLSKLRGALQVDAPPGMEVVRGGKLLTSARGGRNQDYRQQLNALYADLVEPVAGVLPDDGTPIVVEPHSALWLLPFAALLSADGRWLADRAPLLCAPAEPVLRAIREEPDYGPAATLKALIVGNPTMPQVPERDGLGVTLRPLPGAELEARAIAAQFPDDQRTLFVGSQATSPAVTRALPGHQIVHLASHGLAYAGDPNASFVALADGDGQSGIFDTRRVMDTAVAADLVALSACQTGLGKISADGIIGLGRAFLAGGARSVLVSQWNVSDEATARLMAVYYRYYLETDNKAIALHFAMADLRKEPLYEHPRFWAPFVLIGADM